MRHPKKPEAQLKMTLPTSTVVLISGGDARLAWNWVLQQMSHRPIAPQSLCLYDRKHWKIGSTPGPLCTDSPCLNNWADLFLISQFSDLSTILRMVNLNVFQEVIAYIIPLDPDIKGVIISPSRYRNALSEHLAFWTRLATEAQIRRSCAFACSLPNFQPEDKGPDGLFMGLGSVNSVEIHSVKNSLRNPAPNISSPGFRKNGIPKRGKQLDDFSRKANENFGLGRLDRLLSQVSDSLGVTSQQDIRMALLLDCGYNAVVVADDAFARIDLFDGYQRVAPDVKRRIATYIGAVDWKEFAEKTRQTVEQKLKRAGVW